jgi:pimeloyl-ACP methyl ester carboxylesterase
MRGHGKARRELLKAGLAIAAIGGCATAQPVRNGAAAPHATMERRTVRGVGGAEVQADFGHVTVPAVRGDASAGDYDLAFVWLRSPSGEGRAPVVYLEGGPGSAAAWMAENEYGMNHVAPLLAARDVILLDQRGTGRSQPSAAWRSDLPPNSDVFVSREIALAHHSELTRRAIAHFQAQGLRLDSLTNEENAHDVDDLRRALGLEKISLFGFSYGTHLALTVLRRHGQFIDSAVLVGTEGPDDNMKLPLSLDRAFDRIATMAALDPNVSQAGDLWALLERVSARLDREAMVVNLRVGETDVPARVGAWGLHYILRADIGDASDIPVFPRLLHSIDRGDPELLTWFAQKRFGGLTLGINAMNAMVDGSDRWTAARLARVESETAQSRFTDVTNVLYPEIAYLWPLPVLPDDHLEPVRSDVPTLFLSGELDWNTPPAQAEAAARGFTNATLITVGNAGHEQTYPHPEARAAVTRFLRGESVAGLAPAYPPLRFVPLDPAARGPSHPSLEGG